MSELVHRQFRSKTPNSTASQVETKETSNLSKSSAFALLQAALNIFKEVAGKTPVPGLQEGVKALVVVLDMVQVRSLFIYVNSRMVTDLSPQKTSQNVDDVKSFSKHIKELTAMLEKIIGNDTPFSDAMRDRIERLSQ